MEADVHRAWFCSSLLLKANSRNNIFANTRPENREKYLKKLCYKDMHLNNISSLLKIASNKLVQSIVGAIALSA